MAPDSATRSPLNPEEPQAESATGSYSISSPALDTFLTAAADATLYPAWPEIAIPPNPSSGISMPYVPLQLPPMPAPLLSMPERVVSYPDPCVYQAATNILTFQAQPAPVNRDEDFVTVRVTRAQARLLSILQSHLDLKAGLQGSSGQDGWWL